MAETNLALAVSAIIIAYQSAKELVYSMRLRDLETNLTTGGQEMDKENVLLDALIAAENQVSSRYASMYSEFGEKLRIADAETHGKLARIGELIDQKITRSLLDAIRCDGEPLDHARLAQDAEIFRRAALGVLAERREQFQTRKSNEQRPAALVVPTASDSSSIYSTDAPVSQLIQTPQLMETPQLVETRPGLPLSKSDSRPSPIVASFPASEWSDSDTPQSPTKGHLRKFLLKKKLKKEHRASRRDSVEQTSKAKNRDSAEQIIDAKNTEDAPAVFDIRHRGSKRISLPVVARQETGRLVREDLGRSQHRAATILGHHSDTFTVGREDATTSVRRRSTFIGRDWLVSMMGSSSLTIDTRCDSSSTNGDGSPISAPSTRSMSMICSRSPLSSVPSDTSSGLWDSYPTSITSSTHEPATEEAPHIPVRSSRRLSLASLKKHQRSTTNSTMESLPERLRPAVRFAVEPTIHFADERSVTFADESTGPYVDELAEFFADEYHIQWPTQSEPDPCYYDTEKLLPAPHPPTLSMHPAYANRLLRSSIKSRPHPATDFAFATAPTISRCLSPAATLHAVSPEFTVLGEASRENNYWGFCKGAWQIRKDVGKGLKLQTRLAAVCNTISASYHCRQCHFQSDALTQSPFAIDNKVYAMAGALYRWTFLAKSHVEIKNPMDFIGSSDDKSRGSSYGCMFCAERGAGAHVFGNVKTLMEHIVAEHGDMMKSADVQKRTKCIYGRVATMTEDFDICVPGTPVVDPLPPPKPTPCKNKKPSKNKKSQRFDSMAMRMMIG